MRIGVLTGGGDCPGLNAVIRGIVRKGINVHEHEFVGFRYGWAGVLKNEAIDLTNETTRGILHRGGTILGSSRTNPFKVDGGVDQVRESMRQRGLNALIPIGGEDTLGVARRLVDEGIPVVGVPKTIDNDLAGTDFTFGFQTAVQIATDAIDRLHTTAESHNRVIIVEVMGRHAGWIAAYSGIAGGADVILVPERPFDVDEVCQRIKHRHDGRLDVLDRRRRRGRDAEGRRDRHRVRRRDRRVRPRPARRHRGRAREGDRGAHRVRVAHDDPRPRPARRHPAAPTTACSARASASRRSTRSTDGDFGKMVALRGTDDRARAARRGAGRAEAARHQALYETAEVFFG